MVLNQIIDLMGRFLDHKSVPSMIINVVLNVLKVSRENKKCTRVLFQMNNRKRLLIGRKK